MTPDKSGRCQRCRSASVYWPRTLTVLGPMDLCGDCYWKYLRAIEPLEAYFESQNLTSANRPNTTNTGAQTNE